MNARHIRNLGAPTVGINRLEMIEEATVSESTHVIFNPTAGGGRARKLLPMILIEAKRLFGRRWSLCITRRPGHATSSARECALNGTHLIIVVGGDGTIHEVANGLIKGGIATNPLCQLGIVNCGTGHGLAQSLCLPPTAEAQLALACTGEGRPIDLGHVAATGRDGTSVERLFVSECQVGLGGEVVAGVGRHHKALGGAVGFGSVALTTALRSTARSMHVTFRDGRIREGAYLGLTIGNGPYCGGGMKLVPDARVDDGHLDALLIHDMNVPRRVVTFSQIYSGRHVNLPHCSVQKTTGLSIRSPHSITVAADGELLGTTPCTIDVVPRAIRVRWPASP